MIIDIPTGFSVNPIISFLPLIPETPSPPLALRIRPYLYRRTSDNDAFFFEKGLPQNDCQFTKGRVRCLLCWKCQGTSENHVHHIKNNTSPNKHPKDVLDESSPLFLSLSSLLSSTLRALAEVTSVAASLSQTEERAVLLHRVAHSHELHLRSHLLHGHEHALELGRLLSLAALREHHQLALVRVQSLHVRLQGLHLSLNTHTRALQTCSFCGSPRQCRWSQPLWG